MAIDATSVPSARPTTGLLLPMVRWLLALGLVVPLAFIGVFVLVTGRASVARLLVVTVGTAAFLELVNVARVELLVLAAIRGDASAFGWMHDTLGSPLMLGAFTVALVMFFRFGFLGRVRGAGRSAGQHGNEEQA